MKLEENNNIIVLVLNVNNIIIFILNIMCPGVRTRVWVITQTIKTPSSNIKCNCEEIQEMAPMCSEYFESVESQITAIR